MNDTTLTTEQITKLGAIPDNMIYWSTDSDPHSWETLEETKWEIEVDFD